MKTMFRRVLTTASLLLCFSTDALSCGLVNFVAMPLDQNLRTNPIKAALETAYPGLSVNDANGFISFPNGEQVALGETRHQMDPLQRLANPTVREQFLFVYPLGHDLESRKLEFNDPGRLRNDAFFRALYFGDKKSAQATLTRVKYKSKKVSKRFSVTTKNCVAVQLAAALKEAAGSAAFETYFRESGGSFSWRLISGTKRLSVHSFGAAIDIDPKLGQYWKWRNPKPGTSHVYKNKIPLGLVEIFEKYGFIWGGKWFHYDGMHFEYRPELILHSRLVS